MSLSPLCRSLPTALSLAFIATGAALAAPSTQLTLSGDVEHAGVLKLGDLQALPAVTQSVSFGSGTGTQAHTYTGASLWSTLGIQTHPAVKNDILNKVVLVTGTDGYRTVFSGGELSPSFGNRPDLLAYSETINGVTAPLAGDGFARITAPGDVKGGRYVSNVASIDVRSSASTFKATGGGVSTQFSVSGAVAHSMSFDLASLQALPAIQQTVGATTYTGASFWDLLSTKVGLATDPNAKNDVLSFYVVATGSDGYRAAFSMGELDPAFGHQPDLIAYSANGKPLGDSGFARLVVPNDIKAGRYVSNIVSLEVFRAVAPVPETGTVAMMMAGLGLLGWRVRRARPR
jgi:DMSO/TMAO reductase YedYZ molybdopterin-dependent catalytic subunit